ncbi:hypothetical protein GCM10010121_066740 [Streptomyces brasiliensis]|uniref:Uncharacterized protein n=1 Tax=Streptomyces brasiliensis TaxID=1954 RepID=A0A917P087_9ACTN|nr:hypothetical protein GCM10010121_066740 [Streptomyces brasiliensis]
MTGESAEDFEGAGDLGLGADDGAHQRGLAAARGAEQAGDLAAWDGEFEAAEDGAGSAYDGEADGPDRGGLGRTGQVIHHAMNNALRVGTRQVPDGVGLRGYPPGLPHRGARSDAGLPGPDMRARQPPEWVRGLPRGARG